MLPHPFKMYVLVKARQQELWRAAERNRRAHEANAEKPTETAFTLSRVGSLLHILACWLKAPGKAIAALARSRFSSPTQAPARSDQRTAASILNLPRLQPLKANHPPLARRADHIPSQAACAPEHLN